jgi:hypothetical protein
LDYASCKASFRAMQLLIARLCARGCGWSDYFLARRKALVIKNTTAVICSPRVNHSLYRHTPYCYRSTPKLRRRTHGLHNSRESDSVDFSVPLRIHILPFEGGGFLCEHLPVEIITNTATKSQAQRGCPTCLYQYSEAEDRASSAVLSCVTGILNFTNYNTWTVVAFGTLCARKHKHMQHTEGDAFVDSQPRHVHGERWYSTRGMRFRMGSSFNQHPIESQASKGVCKTCRRGRNNDVVILAPCHRRRQCPCLCGKRIDRKVTEATPCSLLQRCLLIAERFTGRSIVRSFEKGAPLA